MPVVFLQWQWQVTLVDTNFLVETLLFTCILNCMKWQSKYWNNVLLLYGKIIIRSGHNFAHDMTAQLSWHVQIGDLIEQFKLISEHKDLSQHFNNEIMKCEMGTRKRADSRLASSQWETSLQSNAVSHWLSANLESALRQQWVYRILVYKKQWEPPSRAAADGMWINGYLQMPPLLVCCQTMGLKTTP